MSRIMTGVARKGGGRGNSRLPAWFLLHLAAGEGVLLSVCAGIACCKKKRKKKRLYLCAGFFFLLSLHPPTPHPNPCFIRIESTSGASWFSGSTNRLSENSSGRSPLAFHGRRWLKRSFWAFQRSTAATDHSRGRTVLIQKHAIISDGERSWVRVMEQQQVLQGWLEERWNATEMCGFFF